MRGLCISGTANPDNEITSLIIWFVEDFLSLATEKLHSLGLGRGIWTFLGFPAPSFRPWKQELLNGGYSDSSK